MQKYYAYTFIEMLVSFSIIIILISLAIVGLNNFFKEENDEVFKSKLLMLIKFAQQESFARFKPIILCGGDTTNHCNQNWSAKIIVIDAENKTLLNSFNSKIPINALHVRAYPFYRDYLLFSPLGLHHVDNASFWYCKDKHGKWAIIINQLGRTRIQYPDKKGVLRVNQKILSCENVN